MDRLKDSGVKMNKSKTDRASSRGETPLDHPKPIWQADMMVISRSETQNQLRFGMLVDMKSH